MHDEPAILAHLDNTHASACIVPPRARGSDHQKGPKFSLSGLLFDEPGGGGKVAVCKAIDRW